MKYVGYSGGGEAIAGILSGDVAVGVSGVSEFESQIGPATCACSRSAPPSRRTSPETAPTLEDAGYDIDFSNWRALVAAPGLSDEAKAGIAEAVDDMHGTDAWHEALETDGWADFYRPATRQQCNIDVEIERGRGALRGPGAVTTAPTRRRIGPGDPGRPARPSRRLLTARARPQQ